MIREGALAESATVARENHASTHHASSLAVDDAEDVRLAHDEHVVAVDLDLGAGILAVEDRVAVGDGHGHVRAVLSLARADGQDGAAHGLLLGGVGDVETAGGLGLGLLGLDDDAVAERLNRCCHGVGGLGVRKAPKGARSGLALSQREC